MRMLRHRAYFVLERAGPRRLELEPIAARAGLIHVAGRKWREQHGAAFEIAQAVLRPAVLGVALYRHDELRAEHAPHLTFDADVARRQTIQCDVDFDRDAVRERDLRRHAAEQLQ